MNQLTAVKVARNHLYNPISYVGGTCEDYHLIRELNYVLCVSFSRLAHTIGENNIVNKDIYMLVEAWMMSQGSECRKALVHKDMPEEIKE